MGIFGNKCSFLGDNDEILFFILVFLILFGGNMFEGIGGLQENSTILFFILVFLLLFFNNGEECVKACD